MQIEATIPKPSRSWSQRNTCDRFQWIQSRSPPVRGPSLRRAIRTHMGSPISKVVRGGCLGMAHPMTRSEIRLGARSARGFTYLWVLALIPMLGVGYALTAEVYATGVARDKEQQLLFIGHEFRNAI